MCGAKTAFRCITQARVITFNTAGNATYSIVDAGNTFAVLPGNIVEVIATSGNEFNGPLIIKVYTPQ